MSEVIGEFHIKRYDDGKLELEAGGYPSIEQLAFDLGDTLNANLGGEEDTFIQRRTQAHYLVENFANGLQTDPAAITWRDPQDKEYLPKSASIKVLFAIKRHGMFIDSHNLVKLGYYAPDTEEFIEEPCNHNSYAAFVASEVQCWMPVPYPISFEKEEDI